MSNFILRPLEVGNSVPLGDWLEKKKVTGYMEIQKKNFKISENFLSEKKILVPTCQKLNNFCLDDGIFFFLEKKIYFHKKRRFFFSNGGSDGGGTFRLHFWNVHKIWI